jgi:hypothetical protein
MMKPDSGVIRVLGRDVPRETSYSVSGPTN